MTDLDELYPTMPSVPPEGLKLPIPPAESAHREKRARGWIWTWVAGRGGPAARKKHPFPPSKKKVPETFGDPAQNTDLDALYPTIPSVPRETMISGPEHFLRRYTFCISGPPLAPGPG